MPKYFADEHDFKAFPELTNSQLQNYGFGSPHVQLTEDFEAEVVRVHDGDTMTLRTESRDFDFPVRLANVDTPELNAGQAGIDARDFVKSMVEGEMVTVKINRFNRVGKYGRLIGDIHFAGMSLSDALIRMGYGVPFSERKSSELPDINKTLRLNQWF